MNVTSMTRLLGVSYLTRQFDEFRLGKDALIAKLIRRPLWQQVNKVVDIVSGNPLRWGKVHAISRALDKHDVVVYVDYDVTVNVDCLGAARLLDVLFEPSYTGTKPSIVVRDSPVDADCLNTGFVAFRKTAFTRAFLKQWQAKMHWAAVIHADQGAFA